MILVTACLSIVPSQAVRLPLVRSDPCVDAVHLHMAATPEEEEEESAVHEFHSSSLTSAALAVPNDTSRFRHRGKAPAHFLATMGHTVVLSRDRSTDMRYLSDNRPFYPQTQPSDCDSLHAFVDLGPPPSSKSDHIQAHAEHPSTPSDPIPIKGRAGENEISFQAGFVESEKNIGMDPLDRKVSDALVAHATSATSATEPMLGTSIDDSSGLLREAPGNVESAIVLVEEVYPRSRIKENHEEDARQDFNLGNTPPSKRSLTQQPVSMVLDDSTMLAQTSYVQDEEAKHSGSSKFEGNPAVEQISHSFPRHATTGPNKSVMPRRPPSPHGSLDGIEHVRLKPFGLPPSSSLPPQGSAFPPPRLFPTDAAGTPRPAASRQIRMSAESVNAAEGSESDGRDGRDEPLERLVAERLIKEKPIWEKEVLDRVWSQELDNLFTRLHHMRDSRQQSRKDMANKMQSIRELRRKKDDADNSFMQLIRPRLAAGAAPPTPGPDLMMRFGAMQARRDECNTAEAEYEQMELQLAEEDAELTILEGRFFTLLFKAIKGNVSREPSPPPEPEERAPPSGASKTSLLGISRDLPDDVHPFYLKLLDAVGDKDLAREHLTELRLHREAILYQREMKLKAEQNRNPPAKQPPPPPQPPTLWLPMSEADSSSSFGSDVSDDDEEFLRDFPREEAEAQRELTEATERVDRLRRLCIEKGYMRKNAPYHEEYSILSAASGGDGAPPHIPGGNMSIHDGDTTNANHNPEAPLAHPQFPIILSNPSHVLQDPPATARAALKLALRLPDEHPKRAVRVGEAMKEFGILTLFDQVAPDNKSDFINRWLLHRLRISPLEVWLLHTIFSAKLKPVNLRRWQEDVLYHWPRDQAAMADPARFSGPVTLSASERERSDEEEEEERSPFVMWERRDEEEMGSQYAEFDSASEDGDRKSEPGVPVGLGLALEMGLTERAEVRTEVRRRAMSLS